MKHGVQFQPAGDRSLFVQFGCDITLETNAQIVKFLRLLKSKPIAGIRNLQPAYCSVLVDFDALALTHDSLQEILLGYVEQLDRVSLPDPREVDIPVCYESDVGPDLNDVAKLHGLSLEQVIELHSSVTYVVFFLGFVPGFAYLGGLPDALATPRLPTPRRTTPAGSVGIAENQTGIYPFATPGGWRIIGRTPMAMFRPERDNMSLLNIGDRVRFRPISRGRFDALRES